MLNNYGLNLGCGKVYLQDKDLPILNIDLDKHNCSSLEETKKKYCAYLNKDVVKLVCESFAEFSNAPFVKQRDRVFVDVFADITDKLSLTQSLSNHKDIKITRIYALQVLEHFPEKDILSLLRLWASFLEPGGELFISVPDMLEACMIIAQSSSTNALQNLSNIKSMCRLIYGGQSDEHDFHKSAFTETKLSSLFLECGFNDLTLLPNFYWHPAIVMRGIKQ